MANRVSKSLKLLSPCSPLGSASIFKYLLTEWQLKLPTVPALSRACFGILSSGGWYGNAWVSPLTVTSMAGYDDDDDVDIRVRRRRQPIETRR